MLPPDEVIVHGASKVPQYMEQNVVFERLNANKYG